MAQSLIHTVLAQLAEIAAPPVGVALFVPL